LLFGTATVQTLGAALCGTSRTLPGALCADETTGPVLLCPPETSSCPCQAHVDGVSGVRSSLSRGPSCFCGVRAAPTHHGPGALSNWHPSLRHRQWDNRRLSGVGPALPSPCTRGCGAWGVDSHVSLTGTGGRVGVAGLGRGRSPCVPVRSAEDGP